MAELPKPFWKRFFKAFNKLFQNFCKICLHKHTQTHQIVNFGVFILNLLFEGWNLAQEIGQLRVQLLLQQPFRIGHGRQNSSGLRFFGTFWSSFFRGRFRKFGLRGLRRRRRPDSGLFWCPMFGENDLGFGRLGLIHRTHGDWDAGIGPRWCGSCRRHRRQRINLESDVSFESQVVNLSWCQMSKWLSCHAFCVHRW